MLDVYSFLLVLQARCRSSWSCLFICACSSGSMFMHFCSFLTLDVYSFLLVLHTVKKYFLAWDNLSQKLIHKKNYLASRKNVPICDRIFKINYLKSTFLRKFISFEILFFTVYSIAIAPASHLHLILLWYYYIAFLFPQKLDI